MLLFADTADQDVECGFIRVVALNADDGAALGHAADADGEHDGHGGGQALRDRHDDDGNRVDEETDLR